MASTNPFDEDFDPSAVAPSADTDSPPPFPFGGGDTQSPFEDGWVEPEVEAKLTGPMITEPGAYPDIDAEDYHGNPNLLPEPSLSSSGAKLLLNKSPYHFWANSLLNPNRPPQPERSHFAIGRMAHDLILLPERPIEDFYHVLPEGFAWNKTNQMRWEIEEANTARREGKTLIKAADAVIAYAAADSLKRNELAMACITNGVTEETLVWKDEETGVWLRARPDFRPHSIVDRLQTRVVADIKVVAETSITPQGFSRHILNYGYHVTAAMYWEGIEKVHGIAPTHWVHVPVEKAFPFTAEVYPLPMEDIERGRQLMRRAVRLFADCLSKDKWPSHTSAEPVEVGLPIFARMNHDNNDPDEAAFVAAA